MSTGATGTIPVFDCIPDLGTTLDIPFLFAQPLKCCKPNGNQLYSLGYAGVQVAGYLTEDLFAGLTGFTGFTGPTGSTGATGATGGAQIIADAISRAEFWFGRLTVFMVLPWLLIFIALFIYLGITGGMSGFAVIIFIIMTLVVAGFALFLILWDARYTVLNISNDVKLGVNVITDDVRRRVSSVSDRWNQWQKVLGEYLIESYRLGSSCNPNENQVCCNYKGDCPSCELGFFTQPGRVQPNTTGQLTFSINLPVGSTGGYIIIPPELNNGTSVTIPFGPSGPTGPFTYTAINQETVGVVDAVVSKLGGPFVLSTTVFITNIAMEDVVAEEPMMEVNMEELDAETLVSMEQLQKALAQTQLLQQKLQERLQKSNEKQINRGTLKVGGCRGCGDK